MKKHEEDTIRAALIKHDKLHCYACDILRTHDNTLLRYTKTLRVSDSVGRVAFLISLVSLAASLIALAQTM